MSTRKIRPIYERGNAPIVMGGQGRSDHEIGETGMWFALFLIMVVVAILACLFGLALGGG